MSFTFNPFTGKFDAKLSRLKEHTDVPSYPGSVGSYVLEYTQATDSFGWVTAPAADGNGIFDAGNNGGAIAVSTLSLAGTLNFDSNTFVIDGVNGRIGIGIAVPTADLHVRFPNSTASLRGVNIGHPSALIIGINHHGNMGIGAQPNTSASGGIWINMETMNNPTIGISYEFKSTAAGAKVALDMRSDPSNLDSSMTYIRIVDSNNNGNQNKGGITIDLRNGGGTGQMKALQILNGISLFADDLEFTDTAKGIIMEDRTSGVRQRMYLDAGSLLTENA